MKPYAALNKSGSLVLVLSKTTALLHAHPQGVCVVNPMDAPKKIGGDAHAIDHMRACAIYSGAEEAAIGILRALRPFTRHEEALIAQTAERAATFNKRADAKVNLPGRAAAIVGLIKDGLTDGEIIAEMIKRYVLTSKEQKPLGASIAKARLRLASKPPKRTPKKKG